MTDESRPLSRRERRAQELRDAARTEDTTPLEAGLDTSGFPVTDGLNLSRRERRRLERLENPVETWTAEEEMLATGQIPAMTPERIAEQERIEREAAAAAQRDAETSAQPGVSQDAADDSDDQADDQAAEADPELVGVDADEQDEPAVDEAPRRESLIPEPVVDDAPVEDDSVGQDTSFDEPDDVAEVSEVAAAAEVVDEAPASEAEPDLEPEDETDVETEPEPAFDAVADADPQAFTAPDAPVEDNEPEAEADEPEAEDSAPLGMPPGMSPEMFAALFPPGSLQRKLMEDQAREAAQQQAPVAAAEADPEPELEPEPEPAVAIAPETVEEAAAAVEDAEPTFAVADDEPVSTEEPQVIEAPSSPSAEPAFPWISTSAAAGAAFSPSPLNPAEPVARPIVSEPSPASASAASQVEAEDASELDEQLVSEQPSFDAILGTGAIPVAPSASTRTASAPSATSAPFAPVEPAAAPTMWDSHPLSTAALPQVEDQVDLDIDEDELESEPLPRPDLSGVRPLSPVHTGEFPPVEPVPTGQIEVERRERPELGPAGGARHFGWAQVAVLGAVAFVLGVVVWNVAGMG
ncbi:hypothetical protein [Demequina sp. NBRC 110057]|uniref:hypothetical protein n=1 Tax=Demequina sp. NBRC 110057 TaxID=1570346 RepID=UPI0009FD230A|nr:hypothetical protein [Demequina sp. NBRC 110057]